MASPDSTTNRVDDGDRSPAPSISLPKGGGGIRGIGEKFAANPVTGTASLSIPIPTSPARSGFGPQLTLSYDSGSGNGPFGFGWTLSLPAITRKTDKGLPRYLDLEESDVYVLSGAEDLVPVLDANGLRSVDTVSFPGYTIHPYRPRTEGLFARIERWTNRTSGEIHWRSISRDNITTLYGRHNDSRIFDPADPLPATPSRIFSWLICQSYDDNGNAIVYEYSSEDDANVDLWLPNERNRRRTANRYLKSIKYGNRLPNRDATWEPTDPTLLADWMFDVVFDYSENHCEDVPLDPGRPEAAQHRFVRAAALPGSKWLNRPDPFSSHRAGFEVRTYRRCRRVLIFNRFDELGSGSCLVRSTEFDYGDLDYTQPVSIEKELAHLGSTRVASFIQSVTQSGFVRDSAAAIVNRGGVNYLTYLKKSFPPLDFEYSKAAIDDSVRQLDPESLENLPVGVDGGTYRFVDLDGEGVSGILTEQTSNEWFYKPSLGGGQFGPIETVAPKPALVGAGSERRQLLDLAGEGQLDLVSLGRPGAGYYTRTAEDWEPFRAFESLPNIRWDDPNLRFIDLDGDGLADVLITEGEAHTWHTSLSKDGFGPAQRVSTERDEERGPRLMFADGTQSVYLADMCGDGLTDLVRVRNGEVSYWPNIGYGCFGARVVMDNGPWFESPEQFDQRRLRLADIDGSGTNDIIYLADDGVRLYFNQSGNRFSEARRLSGFPRIDNLTDVAAADLLGNGTACLIWSSPLPGEAGRQMRYIDLMGGQKPHLLLRTNNNLGAETRIDYASSTRFYLEDKASGKPWITRLPFPVHVVERVRRYDSVSRNFFVTQYAYHHGYFDGAEREFRGFGLVEQWDTEEFSALSAVDTFPPPENVALASHVPPVLSKTWFHTGVYLYRDRVSNFFAGLLDGNDIGEYYREPGLTDAQARALLLDDTILPPGLSYDEEREACRALRGSMLRQEIYALDGSAKEANPYIVTEQNFTIRLLQARAGNRHAVFFPHPRETLSYHYERNPSDPRIGHSLTLDVDDFGNVLKSAAIGYGRRQVDPGLSLRADADKQSAVLATYTEITATNAPNDRLTYRVPLVADTRTYELTGYTGSAPTGRFAISDFVQPDPADPDGKRVRHIFDSEIQYEDVPTNGKQRRLIEHVRALYRSDDLTHALQLATVDTHALPEESYKKALTPGLLAKVYQRPRAGLPPQDLLPNPATTLGDNGSDGGSYIRSGDLKTSGLFPATDSDDEWWIPGGRVFYAPNPGASPAQELVYARQHFFTPRRYRDPFNQDSIAEYDDYSLLLTETTDAVGNRTTVGERDAAGNVTRVGNDYRVLQPALVTDANRNRVEVAFDALGLLAGTAVKGKDNALGDTLTGFESDLTQAQVDAFYGIADPRTAAAGLLLGATTRIVYDLDRFRRTQRASPVDPSQWQPVFAANLARETHASEPLPPQGLQIQISVSYSDGFAREIQKKLLAESGEVPGGGPLVDPRWVGSGWGIFNNKGNPVRQYEPFFSTTHRFEFAKQVGVSPVLFYDPLSRVVATLNPNRTYTKAVFEPWKQTVFDEVDTVSPRAPETGDPRSDPDVTGYVAEFFKGQPNTWQTWYQARATGAMGPQEKSAADKAAKHSDTPTTSYLDSLGRVFLSLAHNGFAANGTPIQFPIRVEIDIEGNQREVRDSINQNGDAKGRVVIRYDYDMLGNRISQHSMEGGSRWILKDVVGKPIRAWDSRNHDSRNEYDSLRRPIRTFVRGADPARPNIELLTERLLYGEQHPEDEQRNLRTKLFLHLDQAGASTTEEYDFKGSPLRGSRRLATVYDQPLKWDAADAAIPITPTTKLNIANLEAALAPDLGLDTFSSRIVYDALNRPIQAVAPHSDQWGPDRHVVQSVYNESNLLERVDVWLDHPTEPAGLLDPAAVAPSRVGVANIDYDAKGRRVRVEYKNGAITNLAYDPETFRLIRLYTTRGAAFTGDCENTQPPPSTIAAPDVTTDVVSCGLQNLNYSYDPVGNITHIRDDAQQTIYFRNKRVEPSADYTYDAIYRLTEATGREHLGQVGGSPIPHSYNDAPRVGIDWSANDGNAMATYIERYAYDAVGNIASLDHLSSAAQPVWSRSYSYLETSLLEPTKQNNRLSSTSVGGNTAVTEPYLYDEHGSVRRMPHLSSPVNPQAQNMYWDHKDQLCRADLGGGGTVYYTYDASGQRVRKVWEKSAGLTDERIYLGGFEIFRRRNGGGAVTRERETLRVVTDKDCIALVETRRLPTAPDPNDPLRLTRYQLGNHLGSAVLELDDQALIISYEEYTPYGSTSYQAVRSQTQTPKRYRFAGKERDDESGFYYYGARYYAPWLGRWTACDPLGIDDSVDLFVFARNDPVNLTDSGGLQAAPTDATASSPDEWISWEQATGASRDGGGQMAGASTADASVPGPGASDASGADAGVSGPDWKTLALPMSEQQFLYLQKIMKNDPALRWRKVDVMTFSEVPDAGMTPRTMTYKGWGVLEVNLNNPHPTNPDFWARLMVIVNSGRPVLSSIGVGSNSRFTAHTDAGVAELRLQWIIPALGLSLPASNANVRDGGVGVESPFEHADVIYLLEGLYDAKTLAHELFGHTYLSILGLPSGHGDQIDIDAGIPGGPFKGTVDEYIKTRVEDQLPNEATDFMQWLTEKKLKEPQEPVYKESVKIVPKKQVPKKPLKRSPPGTVAPLR